MNLRRFVNALGNKKTSDRVTRRRKENSEDCKSYLSGTISPFEIDCYSISSTMAFRRLAFKTQVFTGHSNSHVRTRMIHTQEVLNISSVVAQILGLNNSLVRAIALGHDIGHTPFGHSGEDFISEITGRNFRHEIFGPIILQQIEKEGRGLNLSYQVLEGIRSHSRGARQHLPNKAISEEANLVMIMDKVAYTWGDIHDIFFRTKHCLKEDFPKLFHLLEYFGNDYIDWIRKSIECVCHESAELATMSFSKSEGGQILTEIKKEMYKIYPEIRPKSQKQILRHVYDCLSENLLFSGIQPVVLMALMVDNDVLKLYHDPEIFIHSLENSSAWEFAEVLKQKEIDFENPDLDW